MQKLDDAFSSGIFFKVLILLMLVSIFVSFIDLIIQPNVISKDAKTDELTVYFCPEDNCQDKVVSQLYLAEKSIHCAVYAVESQIIKDVLLERRREGLDVKLIVDNQEADKSKDLISELKKEISVKTDKSNRSLMHNKFCIFDNASVLVGSANFTDNDLTKNSNDILIIDNNKVAYAFEKEFSEMLENNFSAFSPANRVDLKEQGYEAVFCPEDNCLSAVTRYVKSAEEKIDCVFFTFTSNTLADALKRKAVAGKIKIRIILEGSLLSDFSADKVLKDVNNLEIIRGEIDGLIHNKFCIIDENYFWTGSMNPTKSADEENDESLIFVKNKEKVKGYSAYFDRLLKQSG